VAFIVVVGALQLSAGELMGLVEAVLVGDPPVSLLLLLSVAADGRPVKGQVINTNPNFILEGENKENIYHSVPPPRVRRCHHK
jgi:hypothetical protein